MTNRLVKMCTGILLCLPLFASAESESYREPPVLPASDIELSQSNLIVRIDPKYPPQAARDGLEGWVLLSYTISQQGQPTDISVLDANPPRIFDREARRALSKWRYKPLIKQGKPQALPGVMTLLEFKLEN